VNWPLTHFCATLNPATLLAVTCTSTVHTDRIVAFSLQKWLQTSHKLSYT